MECLLIGVIVGFKAWCLGTVAYLWMECRQPGGDHTRREPAEPLLGDDLSTQGGALHRGSDDDPDSCQKAVDTEPTEEPSVLR